MNIPLQTPIFVVVQTTAREFHEESVHAKQTRMIRPRKRQEPDEFLQTLEYTVRDFPLSRY